MDAYTQGIADWFAATLGVSRPLLTKLALSALALVLYLSLRLAISYLLHRRVADVSRRYILTKSFQYLLGFGLTVALLIAWFGNLTGWAAYLGIVSAGLAIALQDPVVNLAGWIFLAIRKPFVVGDRIEIGGHRGDVIDLRLFQFSLMEIGNWVHAEQSTGRIIHLPNGWVFRHSTANYTKGFDFIWNELPVTVTFESDWRKAKQLLGEIAQRQALLRLGGGPGTGAPGCARLHDPLPAPDAGRLDFRRGCRRHADRALHHRAAPAPRHRGSALGGDPRLLRGRDRHRLRLPHRALLRQSPGRQARRPRRRTRG